jgi:hypothetical protein
VDTGTAAQRHGCTRAAYRRRHQHRNAASLRGEKSLAPILPCAAATARASASHPTLSANGVAIWRAAFQPMALSGCVAKSATTVSWRPYTIRFAPSASRAILGACLLIKRNLTSAKRRIRGTDSPRANVRSWPIAVARLAQDECETLCSAPGSGISSEGLKPSLETQFGRGAYGNPLRDSHRDSSRPPGLLLGRC